MSARPPWQPATIAVAAVVLLAGLSVGLFLRDRQKKPASDGSGSPPAKTAVIKETELNLITLSEQAVTRLAVTTAPVEFREMPGVRTVGAEVMVPPGREPIVAAPLPGQIRAPGKELAKVGSSLKQGEPVLLLLPILPPEAKANLAATRLDVDGQFKAAESQVELAEIALGRARRLLKEEAGSQRAVDEAKAALEVTQKQRDAMKERRDLLTTVLGDADAGMASPITIPAPEEGILRTLAVSPGQVVSAGAPLFSMQRIDRVWLRVPVFAGDVQTFDLKQKVGVRELGEWAGGSKRIAEPVQEPPPSAMALSATVDLFYELDNRTDPLRPGQRLAVGVPLRGEAKSLVVPASALLFDVHGGTWVMENTTGRTFARRRVEVRYVRDNLAVLKSGPAAGTKVVTNGAAELFGAETGLGQKAGK